MAHRHAQLEAGTSLDRFKLEKLLGTGAFGQVWMALDEGSHGFRKRVALKILAQVKNQKRIDALMWEARICGALNHPNVIDVYGVMQVPSASFIIMEYVEGETLSALWKDLDFLGVRFPRSIILDIGVAVCEALYHAWEAQDSEGTALRIVHRDLKPANVMISDRGMVKVGDFGIAKVAPDPMITRTGKLKGTPSYLAPELWQGSRDFRPGIDLWSLGVILWEMAVGKRFFGRAGMAEIFDLVMTRDNETEARELMGYFPQLVPIVAKLLRRDPDTRYQSALRVAEKLRAVRLEVGASGDLLQFSRLVRAGRLEPNDRNGSLIALPALPTGALDWEPLIAVAAGDGGPMAPWDTDTRSSPVKLGPEPGEGVLPAPDDLTRSGSGAPVDSSEAAPPEEKPVVVNDPSELNLPEPPAEVEQVEQDVEASPAPPPPAAPRPPPSPPAVPPRKVVGDADPGRKTERVATPKSEPERAVTPKSIPAPVPAPQEFPLRVAVPAVKLEPKPPRRVTEAPARRSGPPWMAVAVGIAAVLIAVLLIVKAIS